MKDLNVFLKEKFPTIDFENETKLIEDGLLDSLELFKLVSDLSNEYKINIPFDEISFENFNSMEAISLLLDKLSKEP